MCLTCGCKQPNNDHGDHRNITRNDFDQAAAAANITPEQARRNLDETMSMSQPGAQQQSSSQPQSPRSH